MSAVIFSSLQYAKTIQAVGFTKEQSGVSVKETEPEILASDSKIFEIKGLFRNVRKNVSIEDMRMACTKKLGQ